MTQAVAINQLRLTYDNKLEVLKGVSLDVNKGEMVTLLGPSGCGKTTTLRSLAGLETPSSGEIIINGETVFSSEKGINIPTEKRGLSMVFQSYAIWPHMTVFNNVAFGLKIRGYKKEEIKEMAYDALKMVHLEQMADRPSPMLSGGQQQRVALARSIAYRPEILLFDEPLSNLDAKLRQEMREEIRELQQKLGFAGVFVTHDQEEALAISDRIIAMNNGIIEQDSAPEEIFRKPKTRFVAGFIGSAILAEGKVVGKEGQFLIFQSKEGALIYLNNIHNLDPQEIRWATFKISDIKLDPTPENEVNGWSGQVLSKTFFGDHYNYRVNWNGLAFNLYLPIENAQIHSDTVSFNIEPVHCIAVGE